MTQHTALFNTDDLVKCYQPPKLYSVSEGNRVMLTSGGPEMIVCDHSGVAPDGWADCQWIAEDGALIKQRFDIVCLVSWGAK